MTKAHREIELRYLRTIAINLLHLSQFLSEFEDRKDEAKSCKDQYKVISDEIEMLQDELRDM